MRARSSFIAETELAIFGLICGTITLLLMEIRWTLDEIGRGDDRRGGLVPESAPDHAAVAQALADAYGPVGHIDEMPQGERQTFLDMADAAIASMSIWARDRSDR